MSRAKWSPSQGGISRPAPLCCGVPRCPSAEVRACFALRPGRESAAPAHNRALCKKEFQLDWDWVVLFCFPANWVSGTGRTGQSGLGLAASWGCGRADHAGGGKGQGISLPSRPSPAPGPPAPAEASAPSSLRSCAAQGRPGEPEPAPSSGFHWGGPSQGQDEREGCQ